MLSDFPCQPKSRKHVGVVQTKTHNVWLELNYFFQVFFKYRLHVPTQSAFIHVVEPKIISGSMAFVRVFVYYLFEFVPGIHIPIKHTGAIACCSSDSSQSCNIVRSKEHSPFGHENQCNVCVPGNIFNFDHRQVFLCSRHGILEHAFSSGQIFVFGHVRAVKFFV